MTAAADSHFAVIGAGGLGGPILYALAAAGAGRLTVVDDDVVELSNLQRQIQFTTADLGRAKVDAMADELARRGYPRDRVRTVRARFTADTAADALAGATVAIDGSDNLATKFAVNDAACAGGVPVVIGGVLRYTGQALAAVPGATGCYRCLFEAPPADDDADADAATCANAGVLGAAVAVVAGQCAELALELAAGDARRASAIYVFEDLARGAEPRRIEFRRRADCAACSSKELS